MSYGKSYVLVSFNAGAAVSVAGAVIGAAAGAAALVVTGAGVMVGQGIRALGELTSDEGIALGAMSGTAISYRPYSSDLLVAVLPALEQGARQRHLNVVHDVSLVLESGGVAVPLAVADGSGRCLFFVRETPRGQIEFLVQDGEHKVDDLRQLEEVLVETARAHSADRLRTMGVTTSFSGPAGWLLKSTAREDGTHDEVAFRYRGGSLDVEVDRFTRDGQMLAGDQCPSIDDFSSSFVQRPARPHGPIEPPPSARSAASPSAVERAAQLHREADRKKHS